MISQSQIEEYEANGFLAVPHVVNAGELRDLHSVIAANIERSRNITDNDAEFDLEPSHSAENPQVRRFKTPALYNDVFGNIMRSSKIIDIVEPLLGNNGVRYRNDKLNMKIAEVGSPVEWHQDICFYPHTNDDVLAVGIALDDCTLENGALQCIPGSHKKPVLDHHSDGYFAGAVDPDDPEFNLEDAVPLVVEAGSITVHHGRCLHGSAPNTSTKPRRLWLIEYTAADAWPLAGVPNYSDWQGYLIRGSDTTKMRVTDHDVRIPFPTPPTAGSIYEIQKQASKTVYR